MKKIFFDTNKNQIYDPPKGLLNTTLPDHVEELNLVETEPPLYNPLIQTLHKRYEKQGSDWVQIWEFEEIDDNGNTYGVPRPEPIPSISSSFSNVSTIGLNSPNLSNITNVSFTWDLNNSTINSFNFNTSDGQPGWWVNLIPKSTHTLDSTHPDLILSQTGVPNFDGEYWVNIIEDDLVLVSKISNFVVIFGNQSVEYIPKTFKDNFMTYNPITHDVGDSGVQFNVFGSDFKNARHDSEISITQNNYQSVLSLETNELPKGQYRISTNFRCGMSSRNRNFYSRLVLNGETIGNEIIFVPNNDTDRMYQTMVYYEILDNTNTIELHCYGDRGTAYISDMTIEIWRVN